MRPGAPPLLEMHEATKPAITAPGGAHGGEDSRWLRRRAARPTRKVGRAGTVVGITGNDGGDEAPVPTALRAVTEQVYVLAFVTPTTVIGELAPLCAAGSPPLRDVQVAV